MHRKIPLSPYEVLAERVNLSEAKKYRGNIKKSQAYHWAKYMSNEDNYSYIQDDDYQEIMDDGGKHVFDDAYGEPIFQFPDGSALALGDYVAVSDHPDGRVMDGFNVS